MAGTASLRVDAFEAWLRGHGTPDEVDSFSRSIVAGFVSVAGSARVEHEHVATGVQLARDAGLDVRAMERLGELLVQFEATPAAEPVAVAQPSMVSVAFAKRPDPMPLPTPDLPVVAIGPRAKTARAKPTSRRRAIAIAVAVVAIIALAWLARPRSTPDAEIGHLAALDLAIHFPPSWHLATRAPTPTPHSKAVLVESGDRQAFVAVLPLATADPLVAIREAEAGASAQLGAGHAVYFSEGCTLLGARAAKCRGTATDGGESRVVVTHLRIGAGRVVVALFVSPALATSDAEIDAIAASIAP